MNDFAESLISEVQERPILWNKWIENYKNRVIVDKEWGKVATKLGKDKDDVKVKWRNLRDQFQRELKKVKNTGSKSIGEYIGKWVYFEMLSFLKDTILPRKMEGVSHTEETDCNIQDDADQSAPECSLLVPKSGSSQENVDVTHPSTFVNTKAMETSPQPQIAESPTQPQIIVDLSNRPKRPKLKRKTPNLTDFEKCMVELETKKLSALTEKRGRHESDIDEDLNFALSLVPFLRKLPLIRKLVVRNEMQSLLLRELVKQSPASSGGSHTSSD